MKEVVASGRSVEDAKREALKELGVASEKDVEIEVIDEGSKGVFGWGTKFARVKVRLLHEPEPAPEPKEEPKAEKKPEPKPEPKKEAPAPRAKESRPSRGRGRRDRNEEKASKAPEKKPPQPINLLDNNEDKSQPIRTKSELPPITVGVRPLPTRTEPVEADEKFDEPKAPAAEEEKAPVKVEEIVELLEEEEGGPFNPREIIKNILKYLDVDGEIVLKKTSDGPVYSIEGSDLGVLIGKHGQTLEAIQFIVNLILLRKTNRKKKITIDVEGYRARREKSLQDLAHRLADKARRERRNIVLEPMLPSERRIIHLALQNLPNISTFSQGEEPMRKVIISPKRKHARTGGGRRDNR